MLGPDGPYLTVEQAALLLGFPEGHPFEGSSRIVYRQILHSTAPAVARALGRAVARALERAEGSAPDIELFPLPPTPEPTSAVARMRREIEVSQLLGRQTHYMPILDSGPQDGWLVMPMAQATAEGRHDDLRDPASLRGLVEALMGVFELDGGAEVGGGLAGQAV